MEEPTILTTLEQGVLTITLNRPKANAFDTDMSKQLTRVFRDAGRNDAVRVVVLTGAGKLFSAGQDVSEFGESGERSFRSHLLATYNPMIIQMRRRSAGHRAGLRPPDRGRFRPFCGRFPRDRPGTGFGRLADAAEADRAWARSRIRVHE